jgi:DNA-binding MarR family transcriptional regulator
MNLVNDLAELALATRLKRLSERLSQDVSKIYKESEADFEAKWYLVLELLSRQKLLGITEISELLQLSHPAVVQFVDQLLKRNLVKVSTDKNDARRRLVALSGAGKKLLQQIEPVLNVIKEENRLWINEASYDILKLLTELEQALDERSMYQRIKMNLLQHPKT